MTAPGTPACPLARPRSKPWSCPTGTTAPVAHSTARDPMTPPVRAPVPIGKARPSARSGRAGIAIPFPPPIARTP